MKKRDKSKQRGKKMSPAETKNILEERTFVVINILIEIREGTIPKEQAQDAPIKKQSMNKKKLKN